MEERSTAPQVPAADHGDEENLLARYGIVRVPNWRYEVDGFAYTNVTDAVAQAKRSARGGSVWRG